MQNGCIVQEGTHDDLVGREGTYVDLVKAQEISARVTTGLQARPSKYMAELEPSSTKNCSKYSAMLKQSTSQQPPSSSTGDIEVPNGSHITPTTQKYSTWELVKLIGSFNRDEIFWLMFGLFFAVLAGGATPAGSAIFAKCIAALALPPKLQGRMRSDIGFWSGIYVILAVAQLLGQAGSKVPFAYCAERLIHKARLQVFKSLLRQDIEFFDQEQNNAGEVTAFLSTEPTRLAGLSGATLGTILTSVATLVIGIILYVSIAWKIGLVCASVIPVLLATGYLRVYMLSKSAKHFKTAYKGSAGYACEPISAIRTVASLAREDDVWRNYHNQLMGQAKINAKTILHSSSLHALSQALSLCCSALGFWYGGRLISEGEIDMFQFFVAYSAVLMGAQSIGTVFSFAPDIDKAKNAAIAMKALFGRKPKIDSWSEDGGIVDSAKGHIEFRDVQFSYPTRPDRPVLTGLSFDIKAGQYVGIVGASGCGKSTIIAL
jgi:ATP-binding cassette subfamily B (MDR/TAP) protein 1